jgi:hypothetical protein
MNLATAAIHAAKRPSASAAKNDDATALLQRDHADVRGSGNAKLADEEAEAEEPQALAERICAMLTVHATIEEGFFYPRAREAEVESDLLDQAEVEHAAVQDLIAQIGSMSPEDEVYDAKLEALGAYVDYHVPEKEGRMFPRRRGFDLDLAGLAQAIAGRKSRPLAEPAA